MLLDKKPKAPKKSSKPSAPSKGPIMTKKGVKFSKEETEFVRDCLSHALSIWDKRMKGADASKPFSILEEYPALERGANNKLYIRLCPSGFDIRMGFIPDGSSPEDDE